MFRRGRGRPAGLALINTGAHGVEMSDGCLMTTLMRAPYVTKTAVARACRASGFVGAL